MISNPSSKNIETIITTNNKYPQTEFTVIILNITNTNTNATHGAYSWTVTFESVPGDLPLMVAYPGRLSPLSNGASMTVTEKGYGLTPATGALDTANADLAADLVIVSEGTRTEKVEAGAILRLRPTAEERGTSPDSFWRYDRAGLTAELRRHWHKRGV